MLKEFLILATVLVSGFIAWGFYEKSQWPIDFNKFQAETYPLSPIDNTHKQHFRTKYFQNATVITDETNLRCPQDLVVMNDGTIYTGLIDGSIVSINSTGHIEPFYKHNTSGRVFGMIVTSDESTIYYLTQYQGLIKLDIGAKSGEILLKEINGQQLVLNSAALDQQNQILYITRSTPIPMEYSNKEVLLKHRKGSIIRFDLKSRKAVTILSQLGFPNGIVYEKSTHSIIFSQLNRHKIIKYNLNTQKSSTILQNLHGYGDNLKLNEKGQLLIAIPAVRDELLDYLHSKPEIRKFMINLPERLIYAFAQKYTGGVRIDTKNGNILQYYNFPTTKISFVTTILEKNNKIYFASLRKPTIIVVNETGIAQEDQNTQL